MSEDPRTMAASEGVAHSLIAELERGGELEGEGRFSVDAGRALAKLREFQLEDPHAYALLLVEASVLAGAAAVAITSDHTSIRFEFGPLTIHRAELEQLFAYAFPELVGVEPAEQRRRRALQAIALACNAALSLGPKSIDVDVDGIGGEPATRLHITPENPTGALEGLERAKAKAEVEPGRAMRVRITIARGLNLGLLELELIRACCRLSNHGVLVNGTQVSVGHRFGLHVELDPEHPAIVSNVHRARKVMLGERQVGLAGLRYADGAPSRVWILTNGVLVDEFELVDLVDGARRGVPGFGAIVELDLAKDLGQARLRRGSEYDRLIEAIWAAHERVVSEPRRRVATSEPTPLAALDPELARQLVFPEGVGVSALLGHSFVACVGFSVWAGMAIAFPQWILATSLVILPLAAGASWAIHRLGKRDSDA